MNVRNFFSGFCSFGGLLLFALSTAGLGSFAMADDPLPRANCTSHAYCVKATGGCTLQGSGCTAGGCDTAKAGCEDCVCKDIKPSEEDVECACAL